MLTKQQQNECGRLWPIAKRCVRKWLKAKDDEVESLADIALVEAVHEFTSDKGMPIESWIRLRVRNAVRMYYRRERFKQRHGMAGGAPTAQWCERMNPKGHRVRKSQEEEVAGRSCNLDEILADTNRGHTNHALLAGVVMKLPEKPKGMREAASMRWLHRASEADICASLQLKRRRIEQLLLAAKNKAETIIGSYGEHALEMLVNGMPAEPTQEDHEQYAVEVLEKSRALGRPPDVDWTHNHAPSASIPIDAWLQEGKPKLEDCRDVADPLYCQYQQEKYPDDIRTNTSRGRVVSRAA